MSFTSLGRFIPRHFIIFPVIKNRIFLIFLSDGILLVYRKIIGFYISTLYPEPFLNSLKLERHRESFFNPSWGPIPLPWLESNDALPLPRPWRPDFPVATREATWTPRRSSWETPHWRHLPEQCRMVFEAPQTDTGAYRPEQAQPRPQGRQRRPHSPVTPSGSYMERTRGMIFR